MSLERLERIAEIIGHPSETLTEHDPSMEALSTILTLWSDLRKQDHEIVLSLVMSLDSRNKRATRA